MIRTLAFGLWIALAALGGAWAGRLRAIAVPAATAAPVSGAEARKTRPLNVPVVADGAVQGYIVAQFAYVAPPGGPSAALVEPYLLDEAFRTLYAEAALDARSARRVDLKRLALALRAGLDQRLPPRAVSDVLVHDFNYVPKRDLRN